MSNSDLDPSEHPECCYCTAFLCSGAPEKHLLWNKPVLESNNFVVVPTLGHFIPGWLLIIPRLHCTSLGALDHVVFSEFLTVKAESEKLLNSIYGAVIKFEHGSCSQQRGGACIDHAHLHLVPTTDDFAEHLSSLFLGRKISDLWEILVRYCSGQPYLLYENAAGIATLYDVPVIPSQFMRMLIAKRMAIPEKYDWREYPGDDELKIFSGDLEKMRRTEDVLIVQR